MLVPRRGGNVSKEYANESIGVPFVLIHSEACGGGGFFPAGLACWPCTPPSRVCPKRVRLSDADLQAYGIHSRIHVFMCSFAVLLTLPSLDSRSTLASVSQVTSRFQRTLTSLVWIRTEQLLSDDIEPSHLASARASSLKESPERNDPPELSIKELATSANRDSASSLQIQRPF